MPADIFAHAQQIPVGVEQCGRVEPARAIEDALGGSEFLRQRGDRFGGEPQRITIDAPLADGAHGLEAGLAAQAAR